MLDSDMNCVHLAYLNGELAFTMTRRKSTCAFTVVEATGEVGIKVTPASMSEGQLPAPPMVGTTTSDPASPHKGEADKATSNIARLSAVVDENGEPYGMVETVLL